MDELLQHPWLLKGTTLQRIDPSSLYDPNAPLEVLVVTEMAKYYGVDVPAMETRIRHMAFDSVTANYFLLCERRQKGHAIRLPANKAHLAPEAGLALMNMKKSVSVKDQLDQVGGRKK